MPSPRRGASGTPPPTVASRELSRYGRRPQKGHPSRDYCNPVGAGHARPAACRKCPSAGTTPGGYRIRPYGNSLPPLLRFVCGAGYPHPAAGRRGRRPLQWRTANLPAMADVRKKVIPPETIATLLGPGMPGPRPDESARLREPPRADIESAPTGNRCRPLQWRTAGVHPANPFFNNNRRPSWKTSPAGGGLLCVNRIYLLILSIAANSSGVNVVCSTALMLSRICCVLEAPIRTVVTSSWCSSQARAISARV